MLTALALAVLIQTPATGAASERAVPPTPAETWPQFLGPRGSAVAASRPASLRFDREQDARWRTPLPPGSSSPCIWGERVFLTAFTETEYLMLALDRRTGAELWRRSVPAPPPVRVSHVDARPAAPTPCTDGTRVVFYFGAWGVSVRDLDGQPLWEKRLPDPEADFGIGSSPVLVDDLVILSREGCPDSAVHAWAATDGAERWRLPRVGHTFSFGTPYVWHNSLRRELVVAGTHELCGLDPASGELLWTVGGLAQFICTTPVGDEDLLYFAAWSTGGATGLERLVEGFGASIEFTLEELADGEKGFARLDRDGDGRVLPDELPPCRVKDAFVYCDEDGSGALEREEVLPMFEHAQQRGDNVMVAVAAGGEGDVGETHVAWRSRRNLPYVSSPLLFEGRLWLVKSGGLVACLDPHDGAPLFDRKRLDDRGEYYASPLGVEGQVVVCSNGGHVYVLRSADEFELVRSVELGERIFATPAVVEGTVYLRTDDALWAFGS